MQALWMLLASFMFALMASAVKLATEHGAHLAQIVLFRGMPSIMLLLVFARIAHQSLIPRNWRLHVGRNIFGVASMWLGFFALAHLPLSTATSLSYTAPLFMAGWMLVQSPQNRDVYRITAAVLGFLGVLTVLRPSISGDQYLAATAGLGAGALASVAMMQLRKLGKAGEPEWRTVLYFSVCIVLTSALGLMLVGWPEMTLITCLALIAVGLTGLCGQLAITRAFGKGPPLLTAALQYSTIIFSALLGVGFWGDHLDWLTCTGILLIIFAGLLSAWRTMRDSNQNK